MASLVQGTGPYYYEGHSVAGVRRDVQTLRGFNPGVPFPMTADVTASDFARQIIVSTNKW